MSEYMPITGKLREYATVAWDPWPEARDRLHQMCDAIDSIHAQLERENESLKAELDRVLGEDEGATMPLPLDMDGKPIYFGDVMEMDGDFEPCEVVGFYEEGFLAWLNGRFVPCAANLYHHHEPDTWESIIADAVGCMDYEVERDDDLMALVARCKALCERTKEEA